MTSKPGTTKKSMAKGNRIQSQTRVGRRASKLTHLGANSVPDFDVRDRGAGKKISAPDKWSEFDKLDDKQIAEAVAKDPDAAPFDDDAFWNNAKVVMPVPKRPISIRLDEDVLAFFKKPGPGYQGRMKAVLRSFMEAKK